MSDSPNIQIGSITGGQNNIGKTEIAGDQVQNVSGGSVLTAEMFFDAIAAETRQLPEVQRSVVHDGAVEPLKELATAGQSTSTINSSVKESTFTKYLDILRPHAALIVKCVAAFGEASLAALAARNPIVAGVVAVAKEVRAAED